jgi:hypothetical protein
MELTSSSLVAQAHNHVSDLKFFIESNEHEKATESAEMLLRIIDKLYERLVKQGE